MRTEFSLKNFIENKEMVFKKWVKIYKPRLIMARVRYLTDRHAFSCTFGKLNLKLVNNLAIMDNFASTKLFTITMFDYILTIFFAFAINHITHSDAGR